MGGGHYTAYARHRNDGKWYLYDDRSVSAVENVEVRYIFEVAPFTAALTFNSVISK